MPARITSSNGTHFYPAVLLLAKPIPAVGGLEDATNIGTAGHAWRKTPAKAEPFEAVMRFTADAADIPALRDALFGLQGTIVKLTDNFGIEHEQLACLRARIVQQHRPALITGAIEPESGNPTVGHTGTLAIEFILQSRLVAV